MYLTDPGCLNDFINDLFAQPFVIGMVVNDTIRYSPCNSSYPYLIKFDYMHKIALSLLPVTVT